MIYTYAGFPEVYWPTPRCTAIPIDRVERDANKRRSYNPRPTATKKFTAEEIAAAKQQQINKEPS